MKSGNAKNITVVDTGSDLHCADKIAAALKQSYAVKLETLDCDMNSVFNTDNNSLVIISGADTASAEMKPALDRYLKNKGKVIFLGGPAFKTTKCRYNGTWVGKEEYLDIVKGTCLVETVFSAYEDELAGLEHFSGSEEHLTQASRSDYGLQSSNGQLCISSLEFGGYDYYTVEYSSKLENPNLISFWAKCDAETTGIFISATDENGTLWRTAVKLTVSWEHITLSENDLFWDKKSEKPQSEHIDFTKLKNISFGFSCVHAWGMTKALHSFYISDIEMLSADAVIGDYERIFIDGIYPEFEQYPVRNAARIVSPADSPLKSRDYAVASELISCHPRQQGLGFGNKRFSRFVPLLEISDSKGLFCGYAAWLQLLVTESWLQRPYEGSMVACFSATSNDFYDQNGIAAVVDAVDYILSPVLLLEGGTDEFTYFDSADGVDIRLGAKAVIFEDCDTARLSVTLYNGDCAVKSIAASVEKPENGLIFTAETELSKTAARPDKAVTQLFVAGKEVDRAEHKINFYRPKPESERRYFYTENGCFMRDGKEVRLYGVNYMPSYISAERYYHILSEYYTSRASYNPKVILKDIEHIKDIGFNAVSIFLHAAAADSNNMLDLIRMFEENGIYVDLGIRSRHDYEKEFIYFSKEDADKLVTESRFFELDNIVAYDINWEMRAGNYLNGRKRWDDAWAEWVKEQYGSIEHAESLWGCSIPTENMKPIGLKDDILDSGSDKYKKMTAAYYRFMDDIVAREFTELVNYLHKLDPQHLISFRMSMAGSAMEYEQYKPSICCYDFNSLASSMDFMSPEGYALMYNEESMRQVLFVNAYARYAKPDAPVVWKEMGSSVWYGSNFIDDNFCFESQEGYYRMFMDRCIRANTSAVYFWFYPSGFRINEDSDYGMLNPDGSDRPLTKLLREYREGFLNPDLGYTANCSIKLERDDFARGIYGMFDAVKDRLKEAYDKNENVVFTDNFGDLIYADEVLGEAVGGTDASGKYPLRYINGQILNAEAVTEGTGKVINITACNTGRATWRAFTVSAVAEFCDGTLIKMPIETDLKHLDKVVLNIPVQSGNKCKLYFEIADKGFGYLYNLSLTELDN